MNWPTLFDESQPNPGASDADIDRFVAAIGQPLSAAEIAEVNRSQQNPHAVGDPLHARYRPFDPSIWLMPNRPLPADYLSFLRWSNGGWCRTGEREFGFFPTVDPKGGVRAMMLAYHVPQYMPGALPFAFNGGGVFYLFDMRAATAENYPVVCASAGNLGWGKEECWLVADSFLEACQGDSNVEDLQSPETTSKYDPLELVAIYIEHPLKSIKTLLNIKEHLGIETSIAELKKMAASVPCCVAEGSTYARAIHACAKVNAIEPCLGIRMMRDRSVSLPLKWGS
ncbi:MAG: SMI1/KNR4 family protein [Planctomycetes bacterium]|nr:SMI1/KNR4 family protein [Planctomycetota bacterium]